MFAGSYPSYLILAIERCKALGVFVRWGANHDYTQVHSWDQFVATLDVTPDKLFLATKASYHRRMTSLV
jgi:hypothetical protein